MKILFAQLRPALMSLLVLSVLTGLVYPALMTAAAQLLFPGKANGSLIERDGRVVGSELIGQPFSSPGRFWPRPSATGPYSYNAASSSGSNLGPTNPALLDAVKARVTALRTADPSNVALVPVDLVTASGSGLDPHISPAAAFYQVPRVARALKLPVEEVRRLLESRVEGRWLGVLGEPRVNVLLLNLDLDALKTTEKAVK
jgi:K+-transporting ATPase ATPase C chain